ncbi:retrotransposon protein, putative, ty1-copia subclass [Tanacetum coccineum]
MKFVELPIGPAPDPKTADPNAIDKYYKSINIEQEVACLMMSSMSPDLQRTLEKYNAYDMMKELKTIFEEQAKQELFETVKAFHACKQEDDQSDQKDKKKKPQGANGKGKGKNKLAYDPKPKIPPPPKREHLKKDSICHHCKKVGHWRRNLLSYHDELKKRKNASVTSTSDGAKLFQHQVERAKDLLGLIHTDVCGPFRIVSREGASYFITFTNDFNRYGFVYLMKHKHEEFETFKVFQNEVENQLGKKINAIRSDRGGEYLKASGSHGLLEMSGSDKGIELIQEEDTQPSENTSKGHTEIAPTEVESQNIRVPIRISARIPQVPDRYGYYVDIKEYELGDFNEPPNYKVALANPKSDKWLKAMNTEMQSMKDNQVWYLVDLLSSGRTVR